MKALVLKWPWSHLVKQGLKTEEYRTWSTPHRGDVLIVCGKTKDTNLGELGDLSHVEPPEFGQAVCVVTLHHVEGEDGEWTWLFSGLRKIKPFAVTGKLRLFEVDDSQIEITEVVTESENPDDWQEEDEDFDPEEEDYDLAYNPQGRVRCEVLGDLPPKCPRIVHLYPRDVVVTTSEKSRMFRNQTGVFEADADPLPLPSKRFRMVGKCVGEEVIYIADFLGDQYLYTPKPEMYPWCVHLRVLGYDEPAPVTVRLRAEDGSKHVRDVPWDEEISNNDEELNSYAVVPAFEIGQLKPGEIFKHNVDPETDSIILKENGKKTLYFVQSIVKNPNYYITFFLRDYFSLLGYTPKEYENSSKNTFQAALEGFDPWFK